MVCWSVVMREQPTVGSPYFGAFASDRIPKATKDVNVHFFIYSFAFREKHIIIPANSGNVWNLCIFTEKYNYACFFYGRENWSCTLREGHWLKVLEKSVLKKILRPMGEEAYRVCRKLHDDELHALHFSPHIFRAVKWGGRDGQGMWHIWRRIE